MDEQETAVAEWISGTMFPKMMDAAATETERKTDTALEL